MKIRNNNLVNYGFILFVLLIKKLYYICKLISIFISNNLLFKINSWKINGKKIEEYETIIKRKN